MGYDMAYFSVYKPENNYSNKILPHSSHILITLSFCFQEPGQPCPSWEPTLISLCSLLSLSDSSSWILVTCAAHPEPRVSITLQGDLSRLFHLKLSLICMVSHYFPLSHLLIIAYLIIYLFKFCLPIWVIISTKQNYLSLVYIVGLIPNGVRQRRWPLSINWIN